MRDEVAKPWRPGGCWWKVWHASPPGPSAKTQAESCLAAADPLPAKEKSELAQILDFAGGSVVSALVLSLFLTFSSINSQVSSILKCVCIFIYSVVCVYETS